MIGGGEVEVIDRGEVVGDWWPMGKGWWLVAGCGW